MSDLNATKNTNTSLLTRDRISALVFLTFCLGYGYQTSLIPLFPGDEYEPFTARTLPHILTFVGIALSLLLMFSPSQGDSESLEIQKPQSHVGLLLQFIVLMALYGLGLTYVGFVLATIGFLIVGFYLLGERRKKVLFGASIPFVVLFYLLLTQVLDIYLEPGLIFLLWK